MVARSRIGRFRPAQYGHFGQTLPSLVVDRSFVRAPENSRADDDTPHVMLWRKPRICGPIATSSRTSATSEKVGYSGVGGSGSRL